MVQKGFINAFKAFIKPSDASQKSLKIKIKLIFFNSTFWIARGVTGKSEETFIGKIFIEIQSANC